MNNFEKIKQMNIDEMAKFISSETTTCKYGDCYDCEVDTDGCINGIKKWLESEVEE